jgi:phage protein
MRPKKYPYSGVAKTKKTTKKEKLELVVFPNIAIRKDLLKHVWTTTKNHDNSTILYFRIPKLFGFGYEEQRAKVNLSYEETLKIINGV